MDKPFIPRSIYTQLKTYLQEFPAVAVLGPRQCGKSTLARMYIRESGNVVYLDLERPSDKQKIQEPELYFAQHWKR